MANDIAVRPHSSLSSFPDPFSADGYIMQGNSLSPSFVYSQTRNLPIETWQEIFWLASHIKATDEFITNAGSYNRNIWDGRNAVNAEMTSWELSKALRMRCNITLVCKAWHAMGIKILYSHIIISRALWSGPTRLRQFVDNPHLSHTKRLTIEPDTAHYTSDDLSYRLALPWPTLSWTRLPQLQILDAPGGIFLSSPEGALLPLPNQSLPNHLTVAIFRGMRDMRFDLPSRPSYHLHGPWGNIKILKIDFNSLGHDSERLSRMDEMSFASVEELSFNEGNRHDAWVSVGVVNPISSQWRFPKLHTLSIWNFQWRHWWDFLEAHSRTLKILSLTAYRNWYSLLHKKIEFPALEEFYLDRYDIHHTVVAGNVNRVGYHGVGCVRDPGRVTTEEEKPKFLQHLLLTFDYWRHFPAATTYCIIGWREVLEWLEEQPEVIKHVAEQEKRGVDVNFIQLKGAYL